MTANIESRTTMIIGNEKYKYYSIKLGRMADSYSAESTKRKLDNNEQNIKNWIKENINEK